MSSMPENTQNNGPINDSSPLFRNGYTAGYLAALAQAVRMRAENVELAELREQLLACPDWCARDHADDDPADPINNLILHQGDDHNDGVTRKVMDGGKFSIQVNRTDCPQEGRIGTPVLRVAADLELTTWEQAAELARAILDSFGYLEGADRD